MKEFGNTLRAHPFWTAIITAFLTFAIYYTVQFTMDMNVWFFLIRQIVVAGITLFVIYLVAGSPEVKVSTKGARYGFRYTWWILLIATITSLSSYFKYFVSPDKNIFSDVIMGLLLTGLISIGVGLFEEGLFRGVILNACLSKMGSSKKGVVGAVLISSFFFGFIHLVPSIIVGNFTSLSSLAEGIGKLLQTGSIGIIFAVVYIRTRNLWVVAFYHAYNDFVGFWPYYMINHGLPSSTSYVSSDGGQSAQQLIQNPMIKQVAPYLGALGYLFLVLLYLPQIIFALRQIRFVEIPDWGFFREKWIPRDIKRIKK